MKRRLFLALPLLAGLIGLTGCPAGPVPTGPGASPSPGASPTASPGASPTAAPTAPPSPAVQSQPGSAVDAYMKAVQELQAKGYQSWQLYRIKGDPVAATGLAVDSGHTWQVYLHTPSDDKSWQASVVTGIGASVNEVNQADLRFQSGYAIDPTDWRTSITQAVQTAGGATSGTVFLYSDDQFQAQTGNSADGPVWVINVGGGAQVFVSAETGARL